MRIDLFLTRCRLIKRRSWAKRACENGIVFLDGQRAKPSKEVKVGQILSIRFTDRYLEVEVVDLPRGNVSKSSAKQFYRVVRDEER